MCAAEPGRLIAADKLQHKPTLLLCALYKFGLKRLIGAPEERPNDSACKPNDERLFFQRSYSGTGPMTWQRSASSFRAHRHFEPHGPTHPIGVIIFPSIEFIFG